MPPKTSFADRVNRTELHAQILFLSRIIHIDDRAIMR